MIVQTLALAFALTFLSACASSARPTPEIASQTSVLDLSSSELHAHESPAKPPAKKLDWTEFESTALVRTTRGDKVFICSAVVIRPKLAITTAHCVAHSDKNEILLGMSLSDPALRAYAVNTKKIKIHRDYHPEKSLYGSDLAILPLLETVPLTHFREIPSPKNLNLTERQSLERVGFGLRSSQNLRTWTEVFLEKKTVHTLYLQDALSVTGDSGSAIFLRTGTLLQLVGLHSTLLNPGKVAAVYLPDFKEWIEKNFPTTAPSTER